MSRPKDCPIAGLPPEQGVRTGVVDSQGNRRGLTVTPQTPGTQVNPRGTCEYGNLDKPGGLQDGENRVCDGCHRRLFQSSTQRNP